jgi:hypothetical protein
MTREELGNHGWNLLHEIAAYWPAEPDQSYIDMTYTFLESFGKLYPCGECSMNFQSLLKDHPPSFRTRDEFVVQL